MRVFQRSGGRGEETAGGLRIMCVVSSSEDWGILIYVHSVHSEKLIAAGSRHPWKNAGKTEILWPKIESKVSLLLIYY